MSGKKAWVGVWYSVRYSAVPFKLAKEKNNQTVKETSDHKFINYEG